MKTLYTNGTVITMDPARPQAEALVTKGSRIIGIGPREAMKALAGSGCETVDMHGGALFPGFNETHNHLSMYALFSAHAYLGACKSISELLETLRAHDAEADAPILVGYSYDDTALADGRQITRDDLDQVTDEKPLAVFHISAHLGFLNSKALEHFGITPDTPAPEGGVIHRDGKGRLTGRLDELAWFSLVGARMGLPDRSEYLGMLDRAVKDFNAQGFTGVHDAGIGIEGMGADVIDCYRQLEAEDRLGLRVFLSAVPESFDTLNSAPLTEMGDERVVVGGVKLFIDGSIQAETAALLSPYTCSPGWKGELVMAREEFEAQVLKYHAAGHHLSIHGNGDAAIEAIITAIEKAQGAAPRPENRHMLIHCQMAHSDHLRRLRAVGMIPSFFCMHVDNWGDRHRDIFIGPERAARIDPAGEAEAIGLPFTLHVDTPVLPVQALQSIHAAVNRTTSGGHTLGPDQRVTPYGAVAAYTSAAALCSRSERHRGTLVPGKLADMTLLSDDITSIEPTSIADATVLRTVVGGTAVYSA